MDISKKAVRLDVEKEYTKEILEAFRDNKWCKSHLNKFVDKGLEEEFSRTMMTIIVIRHLNEKYRPDNDGGYSMFELIRIMYKEVYNG